MEYQAFKTLPFLVAISALKCCLKFAKIFNFHFPLRLCELPGNYKTRKRIKRKNAIFCKIFLNNPFFVPIIHKSVVSGR